MATNTSLKNHLRARREQNLVMDSGNIEGKTAVSMEKAATESEKVSVKLGYKAYLQLALRTAQYKTINVIEIHEWELKLWNPLTEELSLEIQGSSTGAVIGYAGYFELNNGFKKCVYWSKESIESHRKKLKDYEYNRKKDCDYIAKRIVIKEMLSKWGILNLETEMANTPELHHEVLLYKPLLVEEEIYRQ